MSEERRNGKNRRESIVHREDEFIAENERKEFDRRGQVTAEQLAKHLNWMFDSTDFDNSEYIDDAKSILNFIRNGGKE